MQYRTWNRTIHTHLCTIHSTSRHPGPHSVKPSHFQAGAAYEFISDAVHVTEEVSSQNTNMNLYLIKSQVTLRRDGINLTHLISKNITITKHFCEEPSAAVHESQSLKAQGVVVFGVWHDDVIRTAQFATVFSPRVSIFMAICDK